MIGPTRIEARARGLTRYFGKICAKHAELGGERVTRTCKCVGCRRDRSKAKWKGLRAKAQLTQPPHQRQHPQALQQSWEARQAALNAERDRRYGPRGGRAVDFETAQAERHRRQHRRELRRQPGTTGEGES
jgi:hypothetical protein